MPRFRLIATALIAAGLAAPIAAQATDQDVRCLLASNVFTKAEKDKTRKVVAEASSFFYLGRIDGKLNAAQLKAQLVAQGKTLDAKNLGQVMTACAQRFQAAQRTLQTVGAQVAASQKK